MSDINKLFPYIIGLVTLLIIFGVAPYMGETIGDSTQPTERIQTINVFFNDEGTTATKFTVAMYNDEDKFIKETEEGNILGDSWCTASFNIPVRIDNEREYSLVVSANGDYSIPGNVESGYIEESLSSYGEFAYTIDSEGDTGKLSIFAEFL